MLLREKKQKLKEVEKEKKTEWLATAGHPGNKINRKVKTMMMMRRSS